MVVSGDDAKVELLSTAEAIRGPYVRIFDDCFGAIWAITAPAPRNKDANAYLDIEHVFVAFDIRWPRSAIVAAQIDYPDVIEPSTKHSPKAAETTAGEKSAIGDERQHAAPFRAGGLKQPPERQR